MKVITVRPPWTHAIMRLGKDVENRSRNIVGEYRGPVAIHAAKTDAPGRFAAGGPAVRIAEISGHFPMLTMKEAYGTIRGIVDIVDVHHDQDCWRKPWKHEVESRCSPWAEEDSWHIVLANPQPTTTLIPVRGRLGLWESGAELEQEIMESVRHVR